MKTQKNQFYQFGKRFVLPFYAIGSGLITTVAASGFLLLAGLPFLGLVFILLSVFISETLLWLYLYKDRLPSAVEEIASLSLFENFPPLKKKYLYLGLLLSVAAGFAFGALAYTAGQTTLAALSALSGITLGMAGPMLLTIMAFFTFMAITLLFARWVTQFIQNDTHQEISQFFRQLFSHDPSKSLSQQRLEKCFKVFFILIFILLTIIGTIVSLGIMQRGLQTFLQQAPNVNLYAAKMASLIIVYAMAAWVRFTLSLQTVCRIFSILGEKLGYQVYRLGTVIANVFSKQKSSDTQTTNDTHATNNTAYTSTTLKILAVLTHGFTMGYLTQNGGREIFTEIFTETGAPLSTQAIAETSRVLSIVSGAARTTSIAAFTMFPAKNDPSETPNNTSDAARADLAAGL